MSRVAAVIALLALAALLRFHKIAEHSLWLDEFASLEVSSGFPMGNFDIAKNQIITEWPNTTSVRSRSIGDVLVAARQDTHPPLYALLLRIWRGIFGESDSAARSLSVVVSLIAILLLYDSVRLQCGHTAGFWAAAIMAVATPQIEYAQETRNYAMLVMWTCAAADAVIRIEKRGLSPRRAIALGLAVFAAMATHYYAIAPIAAITVYALFRFRVRKLWMTLLAVAGGLALFALVIGPLLFAQQHNFQANIEWIADSPQGLVLNTLVRVCKVPLRWLFDPVDQPRALAAAVVLYIVPLFFIRKQPAILLWWLLMVFAVTLVAAADMIRVSRSLTIIRYTLSGSVGFYALAAVLLANRQGWRRHILPAAIVLACLIWVPNADLHEGKRDWRGWTAQIDQRCQSGDLFIYYVPNVKHWHLIITYSSMVHYSKYSDRRLLILTEPPSPLLLSQATASQQGWFICGDDGPDVASLFPGAVSIERVDPSIHVKVSRVNFSAVH